MELGGEDPLEMREFLFVKKENENVGGGRV